MNGEKPFSDETVHLITILYRSEAGLPGFLDSLQRQSFGNWRLHVIDNASPDHSRDLVIARADPRITVTPNSRNLGFARGANQGLRAALGEDGEFFVLINNDTTFEPDFLGRFLAVRTEMGAGVMTPRIMRGNKPDVAWYAGGSFEDEWAFATVQHTEYNRNVAPIRTPVDFASGCCLGVCRKVLEAAGLFDESFFVYWEDTDFCMRLKKLGIPIFYTSEPSLLHQGGAASGGEMSFAYMRLYYRSYMQFLRKHFGLRRAIATMLRLLRREFGRPTSRQQTLVMARAMILGLVARLVAQADLN